MIWEQDIAEGSKIILADAQTSGGLLIALPSEEGRALLDELHQKGIPEASFIGIFENTGQKIRVSGKRIDL